MTMVERDRSYLQGFPGGRDGRGHRAARAPNHHMWTASDGKHNVALQTTWTAAIVCPAFSADHISAGPDEVRQPRGHIKDASFGAHTTGRVPGFRWRPLSFIMPFLRLPSLELFDLTTDETDAQDFAKISVQKHSPVLIIAQMIRASLLARATVTSRAGFFANSPTIQSRKPPRRFPQRLEAMLLREPVASLYIYRLPALVMLPRVGALHEALQDLVRARHAAGQDVHRAPHPHPGLHAPLRPAFRR